MRKRNTKEILELSSLQVRSFSENIDPELNRQQEVVNKERKKREDAKAKKGYDEVIKRQKIKSGEIGIERAKADRDLKIAKTQELERKKEKDKEEARSKALETQKKTATAATSRAEKIASKKPNLEKISSKDKSVTATGKAAMNLAKSTVSLGRKVASIPDRLQARRERTKTGEMQMKDGKAPTSGTKTQRIKYATANARKKVGRGIEGIGKKIIPEDFIHEAEKGEKEIKKEKIDVMKGTNKIEVNPKSLPEAKKMTKSQIEKRDEIADAISTREMNKRYGDKNVKYAIATKLAMKKKKKKGMCEAKIDQTMTSSEKRSARNERQMGKKDAPFRSLSKARVSKLNQEYRRSHIHEPKRGVKKVKGEMTLKDRVGEMRGMTRPNRLARIAQHAKKIDVTDVKKYKDGSYGGTTEYSHYEPKGPFVIEAKVDKEKSPIYSLPRTQARNERRFGKKGSLEPQGFFGQKPSEAAELSKKRTDEHKARRGVKSESVSGIEVQNVSDGIKFREYEFIDVVKPEPMKSPKNNITWTEEVGPDGEGLTPSQQRKGLGMSGSGIRKLKKDMEKKGNFNVKKNLAKNVPDEQHTTTTSEETINEISGELANKAFKAANRKYQYADNNLTREKAYKQQKKFSGYASKKYQKLNKDRGDLNKIYNKPDAVKEAKAPVGLMKLAATVAANNKKRKNALQIQKYIGEETPDAISGKDLKRISALGGKKTRFGDGPEGTAKRKAKLEKKRGMKLDDHPQFKTEGKGSNPNKRYLGDPIVTSKKSFTKTGKIGIDYYTDDEKKKSEKEKIKDAKDPKKNKSRERATQNMQMLKRMTPEQRYARKMRIKQQQKDKK